MNNTEIIEIITEIATLRCHHLIKLGPRAMSNPDTSANVVLLRLDLLPRLYLRPLQQIPLPGARRRRRAWGCLPVQLRGRVKKGTRLDLAEFVEDTFLTFWTHCLHCHTQAEVKYSTLSFHRESEPHLKADVLACYRSTYYEHHSDVISSCREKLQICLRDSVCNMPTLFWACQKVNKVADKYITLLCYVTSFTSTRIPFLHNLDPHQKNAATQSLPRNKCLFLGLPSRYLNISIESSANHVHFRSSVSTLDATVLIITAEFQWESITRHDVGLEILKTTTVPVI